MYRAERGRRLIGTVACTSVPRLKPTKHNDIEEYQDTGNDNRKADELDAGAVQHLEGSESSRTQGAESKWGPLWPLLWSGSHASRDLVGGLTLNAARVRRNGARGEFFETIAINKR